MTVGSKPSDEIQAMKWLDLTFPTPAENLACDEALLDLAVTLSKFCGIMRDGSGSSQSAGATPR